jgi:hypothetical protein
MPVKTQARFQPKRIAGSETRKLDVGVGEEEGAEVCGVGVGDRDLNEAK